MGRSIAPDPREHRITVRFTAAERLAIAERAAGDGMTVSDWLRAHAVKGAPAKIGARPPAKRPPPTRIDAATYEELRKQGVNLNQIAHRLNKQDMPCPPEIHQILHEIRKLITPTAAPTTPKGDKPPGKRDGDGA